MDVIVAAVDAEAGTVGGFAWGSALSELIRRHPAATQLEAGITECWQLPHPVDVAGFRCTVVHHYELDRLIAVVWKLPSDFADRCTPAVVKSVLDVAGRWLDQPLVRRDEGYWTAEDDTTHIAVDLLEGRVRLEDMEL